MDIERAKELLSALADGVDPLTGEAPDRDNVCNRPEIIRALHMATIFWFSVMSVCRASGSSR